MLRDCSEQGEHADRSSGMAVFNYEIVVIVFESKFLYQIPEISVVYF